jgi:hypothetical protein
VQTTVQQVGGALGLACLVTLALRHAAGQVSHGALPAVAATGGYALSIRVAAALLVAGGALVLVLLEDVTAQPRSPSPSKQLLVEVTPAGWDRAGM